MTDTIQFRPPSSLSAELHDECHDIARRGYLPRAIRQLGSVEYLLWLLDQHRPLHFAVTARVSGRTDVAARRSALDHLQRRHSLMSVAIVGEPGRVPYFRQGSGARIPLRVIHDDPTARWEDEVAAELANPFAAADVPLTPSRPHSQAAIPTSGRRHGPKTDRCRATPFPVDAGDDRRWRRLNRLFWSGIQVPMPLD